MTITNYFYRDERRYWNYLAKKKNKLYVLKESTGTTEYEKYMWLLK